MKAIDLQATVQTLIAPGKGILAADESTPTMTKRFRSMELPFTEENRRAYREMLFTTPGLGDFISGVILFDETIRQRAKDGTTFVETLRRQEIIPGIKVDKGAKPFALFPGEKVTEGLDGLRERLEEYVRLGPSSRSGVPWFASQKASQPPFAWAQMRTDWLVSPQ